MTALRFYFPGGRVATDLRSALAFGESFIAATDDHEMMSFVDWAELGDDERQPLIDLADLPVEEQVASFVEEWQELTDSERAEHLRDDAQTLLAWTTAR